ncbi:MAG TPA: hypothetical protein VLH09_08025 [Bryobacteraceae bacterium]|nr:hypothetical protein [Bryobacteraceae bacterium]
MTPDALLYVMTGAVVVAAAALILQAALLLAMYKASKGIQEHVALIAGRTESLVQTAQRTMEHSRKQIADVAAKSSEVLDLAHKQLLRVDDALGDVTGRARIQVERVELVIDDAVARVNEAITLLNKGVIRPVRELTAVVTGVRAGVQYLFHRNRLTVERATSDEEMFI